MWWWLPRAPRPAGAAVRACGARARGWVAGLAVAAAATGAGCGYSLAGRGSFLPDYIKTIGVPVFQNDTRVFEVEQRLTEAVRREFIGRGKYRVVPDAAGADALLTGEIRTITLTPTSFDDQQRATRYAATVVIKVELRDLKTDKVLWENAALEFREEYDLATSAGGAADPIAFFGQASNALERLTSNFARTVVTAILEAF
jgi:hypothetical protein